MATVKEIINEPENEKTTKFDMKKRKYKENDTASVRLNDISATCLNMIISKYNEDEQHPHKTNANLVLQNAIYVMYSLQDYCNNNNVKLDLFYSNYQLIDIIKNIKRYKP